MRVCRVKWRRERVIWRWKGYERPFEMSLMVWIGLVMLYKFWGNETCLIAPKLTCTRGYKSGFSSLSTPLSDNASSSHALARTIDQKSTQWAYCQLYTCLYASYSVRSLKHIRILGACGGRTLVFIFILPLKWIANCRIYPNACWYAAVWSMQNISEAEFFIKLMEGRVYVLVDLTERTRVRYVFW